MHSSMHLNDGVVVSRRRPPSLPDATSQAIAIAAIAVLPSRQWSRSLRAWQVLIERSYDIGCGRVRPTAAVKSTPSRCAWQSSLESERAASLCGDHAVPGLAANPFEAETCLLLFMIQHSILSSPPNLSGGKPAAVALSCQGREGLLAYGSVWHHRKVDGRYVVGAVWSD